jgi:hypothetical protein
VMPYQIHRKLMRETAKVLKAIFRKASLHQPCMLFFDEFEQLGGSRDRMSEHSVALTGELLQYLSGMDGQQGIIVMGCTSLPTKLDSAILGLAGNRAIEVSVPDTATRRAVWHNQLQASGITVTEGELEQLCAKQLKGYLRGIGNAIIRYQKKGSGDIAGLIEHAVQMAVIEDVDPCVLDGIPDEQHIWRLDAPMYLAQQLLPLGMCTSISKNIHKAIPVYLENWRACMRDAAKQVNDVVEKQQLGPYALDVAPDKLAWRVAPNDQGNIIIIYLNINIGSPPAALDEMKQEMQQRFVEMQNRQDRQDASNGEMRIHYDAMGEALLREVRGEMRILTDKNSALVEEVRTLTAKNDAMAAKSDAMAVKDEMHTSFVAMQDRLDIMNTKNEATNNALGDEVRTLTAKNDAMTIQVSNFVVQMKGQKHPRSPSELSQRVQRKKPCINDKANTAAAGGDDDDGVMEDEDASIPPLCSKNRCSRPTTKMKNGGWRRQCSRCLSLTYKPK